MWNHRIDKTDRKENDAYVRDLRNIAERKRIADVLAANTEIGVLNGNKYYVMRDGVYTESNDPVNLIANAQ